MVPARNKAKRLSLVNHTTKTIYHHHHHHHHHHHILIALLVFTIELPPDRITIWLVDNVMLIFVCLLYDLIPGFCYSNFTRKISKLELASTITAVLQANRLTKCASQPRLTKTNNLIQVSQTRKGYSLTQFRIRLAERSPYQFSPCSFSKQRN